MMMQVIEVPWDQALGIHVAAPPPQRWCPCWVSRRELQFKPVDEMWLSWLRSDAGMASQLACREDVA